MATQEQENVNKDEMSTRAGGGQAPVPVERKGHTGRSRERGVSNETRKREEAGAGRATCQGLIESFEKRQGPGGRLAEEKEAHGQELGEQRVRGVGKKEWPHGQGQLLIQEGDRAPVTKAAHSRNWEGPVQPRKPLIIPTREYIIMRTRGDQISTHFDGTFKTNSESMGIGGRSG